MEVERTIEFILQQHARTEAMMQRLEKSQERSEENQLRLGENQRNSWEAIDALTAAQPRLAENLGAVTDLVREVSGQIERDRQRFEVLHRGVEERFDVLIKMMNEWVRGQRNRNGGS